MKGATIILSPEVDAAILRLIDYVDPSEIPDVVNFLEDIHQRMARVLSDFPESGAPFQGQVRFLSLEGYTYTSTNFRKTPTRCMCWIS
ncbi:hypothetical protein OR573_15840 [Halomonas sp. CH40]